MKKFSLLLLLQLSLLAGFAQNYTWTKQPSLPHTLYTPYSFTIGTHVYIVSGLIDYGPGLTFPATMSHNVWDFNTVTHSWTQKNNFPGEALYAGNGFAINGMGYVVNGWDSTGSGSGSSALWQYNPTTDTWVQKASFPGSTRYTTGTFVLHNKEYVVCGFTPYTSEVWSYDPATDSWSQKAAFPGGARQAPGYMVLGNYAYVGLGAAGDGRGSYFVQSDWYRYDDSNDSWTRLGDFPGDAIYSTQNFVLNGEGYMVNGLDQNSLTYNTSTGVNTSNKVWKYAPNTDTWSLWGVFPDSTTFDAVGIACGDAGYSGFGSYNFNTFPMSRSFYRFGASDAAYSCNIELNKFAISNAVYNFQANGSFSPTASIDWNFGDGTFGHGTSVIHNYTAVGHYTVIVSVSDTASSCSNTTTDTVNVGSINNCSVAINHNNYDSIFTLSTSVTSGAGPYTYLWSCTSDSTFSSTSPDPVTTVGHNASKEYCVTVTDNSGCVASTCTSIVDSQYFRTPCQIYLVVYPDSTIPGWYTAYIYTAGGTLTYLWDFGDGQTSTDPFPTHVYNTPGRYTICLTVSDGAGCSFTFCDSSFYAFKSGGGPMSHFRVSGARALGTTDLTDAKRISIYPNPASSMLTIDASGQRIQHATVYNVDGQKMIDLDSPAQNSLSIAHLADGVYMVDITAAGKSTRIKFAKVTK